MRASDSAQLRRLDSSLVSTVDAKKLQDRAKKTDLKDGKGILCLPGSEFLLPAPSIPTWLLVIRFEALDASGLEAPVGPLQHGLQLVLQ